ncbi:MAG TPA: glycoside hydrolase family 2 protein, partial [Ramlibacter sp.]|nr:glycoside hydrolase family 2 protein [Ramlibacter sp.]
MDLPNAMNPRRGNLAANWSLCAAPAGGNATAPDAAADWLAIGSPQPVAAALRHLGQWSLDAPARAFDAQDWWYRLRFDHPGAPGERIVLGFDGLATLADVRFNGRPLLASDNMFIAHECEIGNAIVATGNELLIRFRSLDAALAQQRARPRWRTPMMAHQQLRWFRTTLLGRTPGWSPPAAVVGPWRDIWIERRDGPHLRNLRMCSTVEGGAGILRCRFGLTGVGIERVTLELERAGQAHAQRLESVCGLDEYAGELHLRDVQLWWPHTHGEPRLYRATLCVTQANGRQARIALGDVGFRTLELDTANGDFRLKVNGVAVFCRGAVWTPLDPVSLRSSRAQCRAAVVQARSAGMNMLRVAGTMVYEEDHFYEACDEQGILVWQDFMFANMDYPGEDAAFLASVQREVRQQLERLHARPCLAVLCGNSEVEQQAAMWGAPREQWASPLFDRTLADLCALHSPGTPYWPSSAHGGSFPHQADRGTTSYYGLGA